MRARTRVLALAIVATAAVGIAGWGSLGVAGQVQEPVPVPTYSGCLSAEDGTFYGFRPDAVGQCEEGDGEASLSSGDVTEVVGSDGIAGGAKSGAATLGIEPSYRLPQDCGAGDTVAYDGGGWGCLAPLEPSDFAKSDQSCPPGRVAAGIDLFGNLVCVERAQAGGPSTDWIGVSIRTGHRTGPGASRDSSCCRFATASVFVYNPNAETARLSVHAFDFEGRELPVPRGGPSALVADCRALPIPPGGSRICRIVDDIDGIGPGVVYVHADLPVLPFGEHTERRHGDEHRWQLDWYPFCPEHVGTCND